MDGIDDDVGATSFDQRRLDALRSLAKFGATLAAVREQRALLAMVPGADPARRAYLLLDAMDEILDQARKQVIKAEERIHLPNVNGRKGERAPAEVEAGRIAAAGEMIGQGNEEQFQKLFPGMEAYRAFLAPSWDKSDDQRKKIRAAKWDATISKRSAERGIKTDWTYALLAALEDHFARIQATQEREAPSSLSTITCAAFNRPIVLSGAVEKALDAALSSCESRGRAFRTADLLLALLELPGGHVAACFNAVRPGLANGIHASLRQWTSEMTINRDQHPFRPLTWAEHPDIQRAQELVEADGGRTVNEVYLLLGVLDGQSNARRQLERRIDLVGLAREARARRHIPGNDLQSPDPNDDDWPLGEEDEDNEERL